MGVAPLAGRFATPKKPIGTHPLPRGANTFPPIIVVVMGVEARLHWGWAGLHCTPWGIPKTEKGTPGAGTSLPNDSITSEPWYCWFAACELAANPNPRARTVVIHTTERRAANTVSPSGPGNGPYLSSRRVGTPVK